MVRKNGKEKKGKEDDDDGQKSEASGENRWRKQENQSNNKKKCIKVEKERAKTDRWIKIYLVYLASGIFVASPKSPTTAVRSPVTSSR